MQKNGTFKLRFFCNYLASKKYVICALSASKIAGLAP